MKASRKIEMVVLAGAVLAVVAIPALASAHTLRDVAGVGVLEARKPSAETHLAIDGDAMRGLLENADALDARDEGPFPDGGGDEVVGPDEFEDEPIPDGGSDGTPGPDEFDECADEPEITDGGDDGVVVRPQQESTPSIPTTSTIVHRDPDLPFTGGNTLGWALAGVAVASLGVALAAAGFGAGRRNDAR